MAKNTKIPPCGTVCETPAAIIRGAGHRPPAIIDRMTRSGSAAANGIAPLGDERSAEAKPPCHFRVQVHWNNPVGAKWPVPSPAAEPYPPP